MSAKRERRWPRLPPSVVQATLSGHSTFGLVAAALIYIVCLTGVPSVFAKELALWETARAPQVHRASIDAMARTLDHTLMLAEAEGEARLVMVFAPEPDMPQLRGRAVGADFERVWAFDSEGEHPFPLRTPATDFITVLHENFHVESWGRWLVGLSGIALMALIFSGLFSHPRIFRDAFKLRRGGSWRLQEADLHNRLSVWAAPFHFAIALTGAFLGLATLIGAVTALILSSGDIERAGAILSGEGGAARPAESSMSDIADMARVVEAVSADTEVGFILVSRPGQTDQQVFIDVVGGGHLAGGQTYIIDETGAAQRGNGYFDGTFAQQLRGAMIPLHYGTFGGLPVKAIYVLLGAGLCVIVSTGVTIWIARRRERGRPVPGWSRVWTALAWGQVAALALAASAAMFAYPPQIVWSLTGALALLTAAVRAPERAFARLWRAAAGATIFAPIAAHVVINGWTVAGAVFWVQTGLFALGLGLVASALAALALPPAPALLDSNHAAP